jgi:hypothetical protein
MQEFQVKRGHTADLKETVAQGLRNCFGTEPTESDGHFTISYGALKRLEVWVGKDKKTVIVDTESTTDVDDPVIIDTNRRFRQYLEQVTGFNTKERVKRSKKGVEG